MLKLKFLLGVALFPLIIESATNADEEMKETPDKQHNWSRYYTKVDGEPARETTLKALAKLSEGGIDLSSEWALDLGCGSGIDTFEILKHMKVVAVDQEKKGLELIKIRAHSGSGDLKDKLVLVEESFSDPSSSSFWGASKYVLINASYALPFCPPQHFDVLWEKIKNSLKPGGFFAGQFIGPRHDWASQKKKSFFSDEEIRKKLEGFHVEIKPEETDEEDAQGKMVHWHIFHVVAQKR